jgi:hypothetical protein
MLSSHGFVTLRKIDLWSKQIREQLEYDRSKPLEDLRHNLAAQVSLFEAKVNATMSLMRSYSNRVVDSFAEMSHQLLMELQTIKGECCQLRADNDALRSEVASLRELVQKSNTLIKSQIIPYMLSSGGTPKTLGKRKTSSTTPSSECSPPLSSVVQSPHSETTRSDIVTADVVADIVAATDEVDLGVAVCRSHPFPRQMISSI